jgi:HK97 family phage prohead protease
MAEKQHDFSGYATKYGLPCADGRTIQKGAFKHNDGQRIPLVWQHLHNDPNNVLGHAVLEHRDDGVYAYCYLNDSPSGKQAKTLVEHGDIGSMSIYANKLVEKSNLVHKGEIRELSLVLSGANPGAVIEHITLQHSDGSQTEADDEVIVSMYLPLDEEAAADAKTDTNTEANADLAHTNDGGEETVADVVESMSETQKKVLYALLAQALEGSGDMQQSNTEGESFMKKNVFEREEENGPSLTHDQMEQFATAVFNDMPKYGSFKESFLAHAGTYGIDNISYLFPDAKMLDDEPSFATRRMGWVPGWMDATRHTPFSRIKKLWADLTPDAARAKGYITGNQKVEQVFAMLKRTTEPTTIYKKQKLDRDDIVDITDFNVVNWMWKEMRFMLDEEVARAALVGDGRAFGVDDDAIDPTKVRPIFGDDPLFVHYLTLESTVTDSLDIIEAIQTARVNYKGTGTPNLYTTNAVLTGMLLLKDTTNRRIYKSVQELAADLRVADIIEVEVMEGVTRSAGAPASTRDLLGIMVNPRDYTYGADKGGQVSTFDQFDIDYNQNKYLIEARLSGSLLNPKSALVVERKQA